MININELIDKYLIKELTINDIDSIYKIYKDNDLYFKYLNIKPTLDTIREDLTSLPKNKKIEDKYFIGYYDKNSLICVVDLIENYPEDKTIYLGLFMIKKSLQNKGLGRLLINELLNGLKKQGYKCIKLAYVDNNPQACYFWRKQGFKESGKKSKYLNQNITELEFKL